MAPSPRIRSMVVSHIVDDLEARGEWTRVRDRLPREASLRGLESDGWTPFARYAELLRELDQELGREALCTVGFAPIGGEQRGPVAARLETLGSAFVETPRDWLTIPPWAWRMMTRDAGTLRKLELGDRHVLYHYSGLPDGVAKDDAFQARAARMVEDMAARAELDAQCEPERHDCGPASLRLRLRW